VDVEKSHAVNRFGLVHGPTGQMLRRQQIRVLRIYLAATTFLYAAGVLLTLFPLRSNNVELSNPVGGIVAVALGSFGLLYLARTPVNLIPAIAAAMIATPAVMAFHELAAAEFLCLIAVMFLAMYLIAFYRTDRARILIGVLSAAAIVALAVAPATKSALTYVVFVVAIVGAAESFGLVTRALVTIACTDPLTGLLNRAGWEIATAEQLARARAAQTTITVIALDIDDFKAVNDEFGHQFGDEQLIDYAHQWRALMPDDAVFARLGGDEFAACLEGNRPVPAATTVDRIRSGPGDASIGAATGLAATSTIAELLAEADADLYRIKRAKGSGGAEPIP
jgi:GGDEF domain-containing protein